MPKEGADSGEGLPFVVFVRDLTSFVHRWCPSFGEYFAMSPLGATSSGAVVKVISVYHLGTQTSTIQIAPKPHEVADFDWVATRGVPKLAVAVGRNVYVFPISVD